MQKTIRKLLIKIINAETKIALIVSFHLLSSAVLTSQNSFLNIHETDPYYPAYIRGEILVKFKDEVTINIKSQVGTKGNRKIVTGIRQFDEISEQIETVSIERVFKISNSKKIKNSTNISDNPKKGTGLFNFCRIKYNADINLDEIIDWLSDDDHIDFAEPNYIIYTMITEPNDAFYQSGEQWYLNEVTAPQAWDSVTGDTSVVIGIIDTGIDWNHPDLDNNIWINYSEIPGNEMDDDNNGYIDDDKGWDFYNNDNDPDDDNGHGTHVAGVAGAETNNYTGIAGICWNCKLMPLKVLSGNGSGNMADLAAAIDYASNNGVDVINMSLGSYGESLTVKAAIEEAYPNCILVAAAGNDHYKVDTISPPNASYAPMFPACYPFVIGVEASTPSHQMAQFSNFDPSGYLYTKNRYGYNYEVMAPGVNIFSTFPDGGYTFLNGTSMASPIVAGACALLKCYDNDITNEEIFARIIQYSQNKILKIFNLLNSNLSSDLLYVNSTCIDTTSGADNDGVPDAGETIDLWFTVKNAGGYADSVWAKIYLNYIGDTTLAAIIDSTSYIGDLDSASYNNNIPAYTTMTGEPDPFRICIKPFVDHAKQIVFDYELGSKNSFTKSGQFYLTIQNGIELCGYLDSTFVLTPDKLWLVAKSFRITSDGILNIKPGVHLKLEKPIYNLGHINAYGTKDSTITIEGPKSITDQGTGTYQYTTFSNMSNPILYQNLELSYCKFMNINTNALLHCSFNMEDCYFAPDVLDAVSWGGGTATRCILDNCGGGFNNGNYNLIYNDFSGNQHVTKCNLYKNNFASEANNIVYTTEVGNYDYVTNHYWGTTDTAVIDDMIYDFWDYPTLSQVIYQPILSQPIDSAHGFLWKVLINNKNPQEENIEPVGSETIKFDVYFNKPLDTSHHPLVSFGVRSPFTQHIADKNPQWSQDSSIYTCYYDVGIETGDGINFIRVSDAVDTTGLPVPVENNQRFRFNIQAASSASTQFLALAGIGKIYLEWPFEETDDLLGFNLYRFKMLNDTVSSDTLLLNDGLLTDSTYIDYNVHPDTTYYYCYRIVDTDLKEADFSEVVSVKPLESANGDANGDLAINVLDVTTIISYILEQNPTPFLFDAADLNYDGSINILDVIRLVNIIQNINYKTSPEVKKGNVFIHNNKLCVDSEHNLAGIQFRMTGENLENIRLFSCIPGFELSYKIVNESIIGILYSYSKNNEYPIVEEFIRIKLNEASIENVEASGSDPYGNHIELVYENSAEKLGTFNLETETFPNPFRWNTNVSVYSPVPMNLHIKLFDNNGMVVFNNVTGIIHKGRFDFQVNRIRNNGVRLLQGLYYLLIEGVAVDKNKTIYKSMNKLIII